MHQSAYVEPLIKTKQIIELVEYLTPKRQEEILRIIIKKRQRYDLEDFMIQLRAPDF